MKAIVVIKFWGGLPEKVCAFSPEEIKEAKETFKWFCSEVGEEINDKPSSLIINKGWKDRCFNPGDNSEHFVSVYNS